MTGSDRQIRSMLLQRLLAAANFNLDLKKQYSFHLMSDRLK
ncbi:hypothetical protein [Okeania sp. SIO3B5]|nr:hypothetical protein [Okeania sp. SIO3B5]